jgi:hypothetical protein
MRGGDGREEKRTEIFLPNFMAVEKGKRGGPVEKREPFMSTSPGYFDKEVYERVSL